MDDGERAAHLKANLAANSSGTDADSGEEPEPDFSAYKLLVNGKLVPVDRMTGKMIEEKKTGSGHSAPQGVNQVTPAVYERIEELRQRFNSYTSVVVMTQDKKKEIDKWETWSARGSALGEVEQDVLELQQDHADSAHRVQRAIANLLLRVRTEMIKHRERQPIRFTSEWHRAAAEEIARSGRSDTDSKGRVKPKKKKKKRNKAGNQDPVFRKEKESQVSTGTSADVTANTPRKSTPPRKPARRLTKAQQRAQRNQPNWLERALARIGF